MVEFPTDEIDNENPERPITIFDVVFIIIAILASGFSGYTTYLGFSHDLPRLLAIVMAIIIGLGLFIINLKIREHRIKGDSIVFPLIAFGMFFVFSFISNTNAIYTYFLENDIVGETQINAWRDFDSGTTKILGALDENQLSLESERTKQDLDIARRNLRDQITDPANPGLGPKAQEHLEEVETILGVPLTRLKAPARSAPLSSHERYADKLDELIHAQFSTKFATGKGDDLSNFRSKIEKLRTLYEGKINSKEYSSDTTDLMASDLDSLHIKAMELIGYDEGVPSINTTADNIGSFQYTWRNFHDGINLSAIILSILLSIMLDVLTPTISVLLYKPETEF